MERKRRNRKGCGSDSANSDETVHQTPQCQQINPSQGQSGAHRSQSFGDSQREQEDSFKKQTGYRQQKRRYDRRQQGEFRHEQLSSSYVQQEKTSSGQKQEIHQKSQRDYKRQQQKGEDLRQGKRNFGQGQGYQHSKHEYGHFKRHELQVSSGEARYDPDPASGRQIHSSKISMKELHESLPAKQSEKSIATSSSQADVLKTEGLQIKSEFSDYPKRKQPSKPKEGRIIKLETNHLMLTIKKFSDAFQYRVDIEPVQANVGFKKGKFKIKKYLCKFVMEAFRKKYFPECYPSFDGSAALYSANTLPFDGKISGEVSVQLEDEHSQDFKVTIKETARVDFTALAKFLENPGFVIPQDVIQCIDVVLRNAPMFSFVPVGRSFFSMSNNPVDLGGGMMAYKGFYQSATIGSKLFLNVDVVHKPFTARLNCCNLIVSMLGGKDWILKKPLRNQDINKLEKFLQKLKIEYKIPGQSASKRILRVYKLAEAANDATFECNGRKITVAKYYKEEKKYTLRYPHLPCLWIGNRNKKILYPIELCTVKEGQVTDYEITGQQTSALINVSATNTAKRKEKIMEAIHDANFNNCLPVKEFNITINEEFEKINGRIIQPPSLQYANNEIVTPPEGTGVWRGCKFFVGVQLLKWTILDITNCADLPNLQYFAEQIQKTALNFGMEICKPGPFEILSLKKNEDEEIAQAVSKLAGYQLIFVVLPSLQQQASAYRNYIKQAEFQVGCLTQCIKNKNISRIDTSVLQNIILKVNTKLNGINHKLSKSVMLSCLKKPCMIMGADVTHPPPGSFSPSYAAVTASYDQSIFKYGCCWRVQPPRKEFIEDMENITRELLSCFCKKNKGMFPEHIIFYRDGVGEKQFSTVMQQEISAIISACQKMRPGGNYKPAITYLIVMKRHHSRFFPLNQEDCKDRKNWNVPAGTCVDDVITHPTDIEYYLVSHASVRGVARPTRYYVLYDDKDMDEEELQKLTYYLCHMYSKCTRSVSYPAPTYYAHLAAARAKIYGREFNEKTVGKMQKFLEQSPMHFI